MANKKNQRDLATAILLVGLFFTIWGLVNQHTIESRTVGYKEETSSVRSVDLVNKHLREMYDRMELENSSVKTLNELTAPPIAPPPDEQAEVNFDEIPWVIEDSAKDQWEGQDVSELAKSALAKRPLSQQVQREVLSDIQRAKELEAYKEALAASIIEKAKKQGYLITVDNEFKVKSVKKLIEKQNAQSVFDYIDKAPAQ